MYWGTSRWSPFELHEAYHKAKEYKLVAPVCEIGEYHWFHREKVELYMAELYNKIGEWMISENVLQKALTYNIIYVKCLNITFKIYFRFGTDGMVSS